MICGEQVYYRIFRRDNIIKSNGFNPNRCYEYYCIKCCDRIFKQNIKDDGEEKALEWWADYVKPIREINKEKIKELEEKCIEKIEDIIF